MTFSRSSLAAILSIAMVVSSGRLALPEARKNARAAVDAMIVPFSHRFHTICCSGVNGRVHTARAYAAAHKYRRSECAMGFSSPQERRRTTRGDTIPHSEGGCEL